MADDLGKVIVAPSLQDVTVAEDLPLAIDTQSLADVSASPTTSDPSVIKANDNTSIQRMTDGNVARSANFVSGSVGWQIDGSGNAEFSNVVARGTIIATSGTIASFVINTTTITSTGLTLTSGTSASLAFGVTPPSSPTSGTGIYLDKTGLFGLSANTQNFKLDATNGNITAKAGTVGGAVLSATTIGSTTYVSGSQGWQINNAGNAEFNNLLARGEFHSQVLSYGSVHITAGSELLALSGGTLKSDVTTLTSPSTFNVDINDPPTGHVQVFSASDILRIKDGSGNDNWFTISSVSDQTTFFRYVCTKSNGSNVTFRAGAAVADYGQSGQGLIFSTVDGTNAPYISAQTHAGSPWTTITEQIRMGNLNGYLDYVANTYGFAVGQSSGTIANITIDPTNGVRIRSGTVNLFSVDNTGNAITNILCTAGVGQTIAAGDAVCIGAGNHTATFSNTTTNASTFASSPTLFGDGQTFKTPANAVKIVSIQMKFNNNPGSANPSAAIKLWATSGGLPTGSALATSQTSTVPANTDPAFVTFTFSSAVAVSPSTTYAFSYAFNDSYYYDTADVYADGTRIHSDGSGNWSTLTGDEYFLITYNDTQVGNVYQTNATSNDEFANGFVGFAAAAITSGGNGPITTSGINTQFSGLTVGSTYFLSNTPGAIASSAGSQSRKIGLAIATNKLLIKMDNP